MDQQRNTKERLERGAMILTLQAAHPRQKGLSFAAERVLKWELLDLCIAIHDEQIEHIVRETQRMLP